ncbi:MAG: fumarylacetoacetate hydrolase family protein, partial [Clostridia bacterium]
RSRDAREDESQGWDALYRHVYDAPRPEIFFKHPGFRMAQPNEPMGIRPDARWHVPEPELSVVIGPDGGIFGFTAGNDLSARDLEGTNPLYLPQAKMFHKSASLGPSVAIVDSLDANQLEIACTITRGGLRLFSGTTTTSLIRRPLEELVRVLGYAWPLEPWTVLMTGTGIVPPDDVALQDGDEIAISITGIGTLTNPVRTISRDWMRVPERV